MLVFELTRIESSRSYYTTEFFDELLAKMMGARVAYVSVLDDWLSVVHGRLLATGYIFGISVGVRGALYKPILHKGSHDCQLGNRSG
jgi:hypothetical protein